MDIWEENKRKLSELEDPEPTFKTRETDINADEEEISSRQQSGKTSTVTPTPVTKYSLDR